MRDRMLTPLIAYYRVSTHKQGKSGLGLEAQRKAVADFARNERLEVVQEFTEVETGKGADALEKRPQLAAALRKAKQLKARNCRRKTRSLEPRCRVYLGPDVQARALHRREPRPQAGSVHAAHLCRHGRKGTQRDRQTYA